MAKIQLADHFTYGKLLRFTVPSIVMMFFSNLLNVVDDGLFVSNFVGKDAFVALNIMSPVFTVYIAIAYMLGAGGNAYISKLLGENKEDKAKSVFSSLIYVSAMATIVVSVVFMFFVKPYCTLMGAEGAVLENCLKYASVALPSAVIMVLSVMMQSLLITAEKPTLAMVLTIISSACNIIFDILLMVIFPLGITGAICATISGPLVTVVVATAYFIFNKTNSLRLVRTKIKVAEIAKISTLGISQLITNLAISIVSMVFNYQLMKYNGNDGVAAYGIIVYLSFVFTGIFAGYSNASTTIISYNQGANNKAEMKNVYKKSLVVIGAISALLPIISYFIAAPFSKVIIGYDETILNMSIFAFRIYGLSFLFAGINVFAGAFFTALDDSVSASTISFIRTMIFQIGTVLIMPLFWDMNGIWFAPVVAEILAFAVAILYLKWKKKKYSY